MLRIVQISTKKLLRINTGRAAEGEMRQNVPRNGKLSGPPKMLSNLSPVNDLTVGLPSGFYLPCRLWSTLNHLEPVRQLFSKPRPLSSFPGLNLHLCSFRTDDEVHCP